VITDSSRFIAATWEAENVFWKTCADDPGLFGFGNSGVSDCAKLAVEQLKQQTAIMNAPRVFLRIENTVVA
jgi:hypothetical protein